MKKPRNKTANRRLHYLGIMAAAGLITSGAVPGLAQQTIDPQVSDTFNGATGDVTIEGRTNNGTGQNATVTWANTDITGNLIFGDMADDTSASVGIDLTVGTDGGVTGIISNTGDNTGANITFSGTSGLDASGLAGGANGINITNDTSNTVTVSGDVNGNVTLAGDGIYNLNTIGGTAGEQTVLNLNGSGPNVDAVAIGNATGSTTVNITSGLFGQTSAPAVSGQVGINLNGTGAQGANVGQINDGSVLTVGGTNTDNASLTTGDINTTLGVTINVNDSVALAQGSGSEVTGSGQLDLNIAADASAALGNVGTAVLVANGDGVLTTGILTGTSLTAGNTGGVTTLDVDGGTITIEAGSSVETDGNLSGSTTIDVADTGKYQQSTPASQTVEGNLTVNNSNTATGLSVILGRLINDGVITVASANGETVVSGVDRGALKGKTVGSQDYITINGDVGNTVTGGSLTLGDGTADGAINADMNGDIIGGATDSDKTVINVADGSSLSGNAGVSGHTDFVIDENGSATVGDFTNATASVTGALQGGSINGGSYTVNADSSLTQTAGSTVTGTVAFDVNDTGSAIVGDFNNADATVTGALQGGSINGGSYTVNADSSLTQTAGSTVTGTVAFDINDTGSSIVGDFNNADATVTGALQGGNIGGGSYTVNADSSLTQTAGSTVTGTVAFDVNDTGSAIVGDFNNATATVTGALQGGSINGGSYTVNADSSLTQTAGSTVTGTVAFDVNDTGSAIVGDFNNATASVTGALQGGSIDGGNLTVNAGSSFAQTTGSTIIGAANFINQNADTAGSLSLGTVTNNAVVTVSSQITGSVTDGTVFAGLDSGTIKGVNGGDVVTITGDIGNTNAGLTNVVLGGDTQAESVKVYGTDGQVIYGGNSLDDRTIVTVKDGSSFDGGQTTDVSGHVDFDVSESNGAYASVKDLNDASVRSAGDFIITGELNNSTVGALDGSNIDIVVDNDIVDGIFPLEEGDTLTQTAGHTISGDSTITNNSTQVGNANVGTIVETTPGGTTITVKSETEGATNFAGMTGGTIQGSGSGNDIVNVGDIGEADAENNINIGTAGKGITVVAGGDITGGATDTDKTTINVADGSSLSGSAGVSGHTDFVIAENGSATVGDFTNATASVTGALQGGNISGGSYTVNADSSLTQTAGSTVTGTVAFDVNDTGAATVGDFNNANATVTGALQGGSIDGGSYTVNADSSLTQTAGSTVTGTVTFDIDDTGSATVGDFNDADATVTGALQGGNIDGGTYTVNADSSLTQTAGSTVTGTVTFDVDDTGSATVGDFNNADATVTGALQGGNINGGSLSVTAGSTFAQNSGSTITGTSSINNQNADTAGSVSLGTVTDDAVVTVDSQITGSVTDGTVFAGLDSGTIKGANGGDVITIAGDIGNTNAGLTTVNLGGATLDESIKVYGTDGQIIYGGDSLDNRTIINVNNGSTFDGATTTDVTGYVDFRVSELNGAYASVKDLNDATVRSAGDFIVAGSFNNSTLSALEGSNIDIEVDTDIVDGDFILGEGDTLNQTAGHTISGDSAVTNNSTQVGSANVGTIVETTPGGTTITVKSETDGATSFAGMTGGTIQGSGSGNDTVNIGDIGEADAENDINIGTTGKGITVVADGDIIGGTTDSEKTTINVADGSSLSGDAGVSGHTDFVIAENGSATVGDFTNANASVTGALQGGSIDGGSYTVNADSSLTQAAGSTVTGTVAFEVNDTGSAIVGDFNNADATVTGVLQGGSINGGSYTVNADSSLTQTAGSTVTGTVAFDINDTGSAIVGDFNNADATVTGALQGGNIDGGNYTVNADSSLTQTAGSTVTGTVAFDVNDTGSAIVGDFNNADATVTGALQGGNIDGGTYTVNSDSNLTQTAGSAVTGIVAFDIDATGSATVGDFTGATAQVDGNLSAGNLSLSTMVINTGAVTANNIDDIGLSIQAGATFAQNAGSTITGTAVIANDNADISGSASFGTIKGGSVSVASAPTGSITDGTVFAGLESGGIKGGLNGADDVVTVAGNFGDNTAGKGLTYVSIGGTDADEAITVYGAAGQYVYGGVDEADKTVVRVNEGSKLEGGGDGTVGSGLIATGHLDFVVADATGTYAVINEIQDATIGFSGDFQYNHMDANSTINVLADSNVWTDQNINGGTYNIADGSTHKQLADILNPNGGPGDLTISGAVNIANNNTAASPPASGSYGTMVGDTSVITVKSETEGATVFAGMNDGTIQGSGTGNDTVNIGNFGTDAAENNINIGGATGETISVASNGAITGGADDTTKTTINVADGSALENTGTVEGYVDFNVAENASASVGDFNQANTTVTGSLAGGNLTDTSLTLTADATFTQKADGAISGNSLIANSNAGVSGSATFGTITGGALTVDSKGQTDATTFAAMTGGTIMGDGGAGNIVSIGSLGQANALSNMSIGQSGQAIEVAANTIIGGDSASNLNTINVADGSTLSGNAGVGGHVNFNVETGGSATVGDFTDANVNVSGDLTGGNVNNSGLAVGDGTVTVANVDGGNLTVNANGQLNQTGGSTVTGATSVTNNNADVAGSASLGTITGGASTVVTVDSASDTITGGTVFAGLESGTIKGSANGADDTATISGDMGGTGGGVKNIIIGGANADEAITVYGQAGQTISGGGSLDDRTVVSVNAGSKLEGGGDPATQGSGMSVTGYVDFEVANATGTYATVNELVNADVRYSGDFRYYYMDGNSSVAVLQGGNVEYMNNIVDGNITIGTGATYKQVDPNDPTGGPGELTVSGQTQIANNSALQGSGSFGTLTGADSVTTVKSETAGATVFAGMEEGTIQGGGTGRDTVNIGDIGTADADNIVNIGTAGNGITVVADNSIVGGATEAEKTTVNVAAGSKLDGTADVSGTVDLNLSNTQAKVGDIGVDAAGQIAKVDLTVNGSTGASLTAGDVKGGNSETSTLKVGSGVYFTAQDISGNYELEGQQNYASVGQNGNADLTIGGTNTAQVTASGNVGKTGQTVDLHVADGSSFQQTGGVAAGTIFAKNDNQSAGALTLASLDGADLTVDGKITLGGTTAGSTNSLTGHNLGRRDYQPGGTGSDQIYMQNGGSGFGAGGQLSLANAELILSGNGNGIGNLSEFSMDSTNGHTVLNAVDGIADNNGAIQMAGINIDAIGNGNVEIWAKDMQVQDALSMNGSQFKGSGHLVIDASQAGSNDKGINLAGGLDINADGRGAVDFIGDVAVTGATGANSLKVADVNISDGVFKVAGQTLQLANGVTSVNTGGQVTYDFSGAANGLGLSKAAEFNTGVAANKIDTITLIDADGRPVQADIYSTVKFTNGSQLHTTQLNVTQGTVFQTAVTVAANLPTAGGNGIYTDHGVNIEGQMVMQSSLTIQSGVSGPGLIYNANADGTASTVVLSAGSAGSQIAQGTKFQVNDLAGANQVVKLQTVSLDQRYANDGALQQTQREMWAALDYDGKIWDGSGAAQSYDKNSGTFVQVGSGRVQSAINNSPKWGQQYVTAMMSMNPEIADHLGNSPDRSRANKEMTQAMGNSLNAALMAANDNSLNPAFKHLNNRNTREEHIIATSAGEVSGQNGIWATPSVSHMSVDDDYSQGYGGFDVRNYALALGYDRWLDNQVRLGAFLNFGNGKLDGDFQDIDSDSVQIGVYGQADLPENVTLNFGMGYSWQDYDATREVAISSIPAANQRIKSSFDANTLTVAAEVSKTISVPEYNMFVRPAVGYTYMNTEIDGYREKSSLGRDNINNLAQRVKGTDYDLHLFRLGTDIGTTGEDWNLTGRIYYVGNAGDRQPETRATLSSAHVISGADARGFKVRGAEYDRHMFNPGLSLKVSPNECTSVVLDYDALVGSNSESHNVNMTIRYDF